MGDICCLQPLSDPSAVDSAAILDSGSVELMVDEIKLGVSVG